MLSIKLFESARYPIIHGMYLHFCVMCKLFQDGSLGFELLDKLHKFFGSVFGQIFEKIHDFKKIENLNYFLTHAQEGRRLCG